MPSFDAISTVSVMVLECFVCDERSGLSRVCVKSGTNVCVGIKIQNPLTNSRRKLE
jgi:hypothetical protein